MGESEHGISVELVDAGAMSVVQGLRDAGFDAFLVGGCVRDMLLGIAPKDFDVATNATPEEVRDVFKRSRLVGRRFRIAHVRFGRETIEVSTFRRTVDVDDDDVVHNHSRRELRDRDSARSVEGMILRDNVYGDIHEDAFRRDFTINALYYDPIDRTLVDYVGGLADLRARRLKLIGDPNVRFREDPVRILRAIRFATKLGFEIERETDDAIPGAAYMISAVAPARLFDELCKLLLQGHATGAWELLQRYELADTLFPDHNTSTRSLDLIRNAMEGTDQRIREDKPVTPGFLIAVLLWDSYRERLAQHSDAMPLVEARESASAEVLARPERNRGDPAPLRAVRARSVAVPAAPRNAAGQRRRQAGRPSPLSRVVRFPVAARERRRSRAGTGRLVDQLPGRRRAATLVDEQRDRTGERQTQTPSASSRRCLIHDPRFSIMALHRGRERC